MATWRKKGDGWEVRWYAGTRRRSRTFHGSLREVKAQAYLWEAEDVGKPRSGPINMADALVAWQTRGGERGSPLSSAAVESRNRNWTIPRLGHLSIEKVTPLFLEAFYRDLGEHLSPGAVKNIHWDISGALRLAVLDGHITDNPAKRVRFPHAEGRPEIVPPSVEALTAFLAHLDAKTTLAWAELALAVRIAIVTGARLGEVCGLRWGDIDYEVPAIAIVRNAISLPGGIVGVRPTKTRVRRQPAIPPALADRLAAHYQRWGDGPGKYQRWGGDDGPDSPLLHGAAPGRHIGPITLAARFQKARRQTGATFRFHDLRHFAVSVWLTEMPMHDVSRAIGHRRISTTVDTYGHRTNSTVDRRTAEAIARRINL